ncbi:MAG: alpha-glucosidase [Lachnospiraceae bacterium]|jgi:oligo-1,6-glucosidase|nr:alpha-glucosidase [Lachnospiraceae bacterium]
MRKRWWHNKTAYQIYPKSFKDSNGDGIGDLRGIIEKLDYLKDLGIGIVWISPIYQSPFVDQGYDISDYYAIDPAFGTMEDMEELLAQAKKRDIAIVMDLVVNHCSDQHAWFQEALKDPFGPYGDYFYIREGKNGNPPCNWRSYFGGSVWEPLPGYDNLFYLHLFAKEQPDLNWENPKLRQEIYRMIRWWLKKGVSGFRLDAIINIKKDLRFQDFPADREDGMCAGTTMLAYADGVTDFLMEMHKEAFAPYDAFTIGELFDFRPEEMERYIGDQGCFESIFDFAPHLLGASENGWYDRKKVTMDEFRDAVFESKAISQEIGMMANIIENHDEPRGVSRYLPKSGQTERGKKLLAGISLMTFGLPFLYQGQEIGMTNKEFRSIREVDDINTLDEYQVARDHGLTEEEALRVISQMSRDNARTPMQWSDEAHGGFTEGIPWLPVNENYQQIRADEQQKREDSLLNFYKKLIALRTNPKYEEVIVYGKQEPLNQALDNFTGFYRKGKETTLLILANTQEEPRSLKLPVPVRRIVLDNCSAVSSAEEHAFDSVNSITLEGYQFLVLEVEDSNG